MIKGLESLEMIKYQFDNVDMLKDKWVNEWNKSIEKELKSLEKIKLEINSKIDYLKRELQLQNSLYNIYVFHKEFSNDDVQALAIKIKINESILAELELLKEVLENEES